MMEYFIGDIKFKTKKRCLEYTRERITKMKLGDILPSDKDDFKFLHDLLKNHLEYDEKVGEGITKFSVGINPINHKGREVSLIRLNGRKVVFSWRFCCEFKPKSQKQQLLSAFRQSISRFTNEFKQNKKLVCNKCGRDDLNYNDYHTDHIYPFSRIAESFLKDKDNLPNSFEHAGQFGYEFYPKDKNFETEWITYHNKFAEYQLLCYKCNCSKSDKIQQKSIRELFGW